METEEANLQKLKEILNSIKSNSSGSDSIKLWFTSHRALFT